MFAPAVAKPGTKGAERPAAPRAPRPAAPVLRRAVGNQAALRLLAQPPPTATVQAKLAVGAVNDPLEHEADRVADEVMRMPDPTSSPALTADARTMRRTCAGCAEDEKLARKETGAGTATSGAAPGIVHDVLAAPARPLDAGARAFFEPRFGHDFSGVRLHDDARAAESARAVGALGYTVGEHIVFADGQAGQRAVLAHELAHVVQQSGVQPVLRRFPMCRHLLDPPPEQPPGVPERDVQQAIATQFSQLGTLERELAIPGGSAAPMRTEGDVIPPQTIGDTISGSADIAVLTGTALEIIEVKRATWPDAVFAEAQVLNYISKGNRAIRDVERLWRGRGHPNDNVTSVRGMSTGRLAPLTPQKIGGRAVSLAWCRDGVMTFKSMGNRDQDVFVCGASDQGRIDAFLDRALDPAQAAVDRFINTEIEARVAQQLQGMTLRSLIQRVLAQPQVRDLVPLGSLVGEGTLLDTLVSQLQPFEAQIRALALSFLHRVVAELRQRLQAQIRTMLAQTLTALCATAAELTMRELVDAFAKRMRALGLSLLPATVELVATQMMRELTAALGRALLEALKIVVAAIVVVIVAVVLWEVAAAIAAAEGIAAAIASIGTFLARLLTQLIPALSLA